MHENETQQNEMTGLAQKNSPSPYLLRTESPDEFASLWEELEQEIQPHGVIERTYLQDVANLIWEIRRLRRSKAAIINQAFLPALRVILGQLRSRSTQPGPSEDLAHGWFNDEKVKAKVTTMLQKFGLDEGAIEAEAVRMRAEDLERLDRMLTFAEARRDKTLRGIADYRQVFSGRLQLAANRFLDAEEVPKLAPVGKHSD
jgi:hypothetical protein